MGLPGRVPFCIFVCGLAASAVAEPIDQLIVFGDSISDTGNVYQYTNGAVPASPPNYEGRFSNGPIWIDQLPALIEEGSAAPFVVAFGGAESGAGLLPPGLLSQVGFFLNETPILDENDQIIILIGGNDYFSAKDAGSLSGSTVNGVIGNITVAVEQLQAAGTPRILLMNLPPLESFPRAGSNPGVLAPIIEAHNAGLDQLATETGSTVFDLHALFADVLSDPAAYGFTNVTTPCLSGDTVTCDPETHLFWDDIHPTSAAHGLLAQALAAHLNPSATAEPHDAWVIF